MLARAYFQKQMVILPILIEFIQYSFIGIAFITTAKKKWRENYSIIRFINNNNGWTTHIYFIGIFLQLNGTIWKLIIKAIIIIICFSSCSICIATNNIHRNID